MSRQPDSSRPCPHIVLVHLGSSNPRWLQPALRAQAAIHGAANVVLVAESGALLRMAERIGVQALEYSGDPYRDSALAGAARGSPEFRDGFWLHSIRRIFALEITAAVVNGPLIHVENDVVALKDLRSLIHKTRKEVSYPLLSPGFGSGSIITVQSQEAAHWLAEQTLLAVTQRGSVNDMEALWEVWKANPTRIQVLPSVPHDAIGATDGSTSSVQLNGDETAYMGIYDAAAIGQFLLGADPRNSRWGLRRVGETYQRGSRPALRWSQLSLDMHGTLLLRDRERHLEVHTLHNHSKDLRAFNHDTLLRILQRRIRRARASTDLDPWALSVNLRAAGRRRLSRLSLRPGPRSH